MTPLEHVLALVRELGSPVPAPATRPGAPTARPGKIEVDTPIAAFGRSLAAQHAAAMAKEAETWPNPWVKGQENRTRQNIIRNHNPALAARHRAEAGA